VPGSAGILPALAGILPASRATPAEKRPPNPKAAYSYNLSPPRLRKKSVKTAVFLILFPLLASGAALAPDALSAFQQPHVPASLYAKIEHGIPLALPDVVILSSAGVSKAAIIDYLYSFGHHFHLTASDVRLLQEQQVGADLIDYMTSPPAHPAKFAF
jgi:hypothetical protein